MDDDVAVLAELFGSKGQSGFPRREAIVKKVWKFILGTMEAVVAFLMAVAAVRCGGIILNREFQVVLDPFAQGFLAVILSIVIFFVLLVTTFGIDVDDWI